MFNLVRRLGKARRARTGIRPNDSIVCVTLLLRRESGPVRARGAEGAGQFSVLEALGEEIAGCERCPRLREYCKGIGERRRKAYRTQVYWARPVPGFGDPKAKVLVLGLAPGAHGGNRTGRIFTGDGSGDFLYPVLHEAGFANQPTAVSREDGLRVRGMWISAVVRCAPPGDKPTPEETRMCGPFLQRELTALKQVRVVVCLGKFAWDAYLAELVRSGVIERRSAFLFGHGVEYRLPNGVVLVGSYHPSLRNTNTGKLDRVMLLRVFVRVRELAGIR
jgi:uracil-DNA glycosylase